MAQIFMSFIHEEEVVAHHVQKFINTVFEGRIDSFLSSDETAIYAGDDWMKRIFDELKAAKVLISMLSPDSVARPWINFEAGAALMNDTKVIPVCFRGLTIERLPKPYSSLQRVALGSDEAHYYLVSSIAHHLGIDPPERPAMLEEIGWNGYPGHDDQEEIDREMTEEEIQLNARIERQLDPYNELSMWLETYGALRVRRARRTRTRTRS